MDERHDLIEQRARLRRMVYTLFAVYWILVAAALVFPRLAGGAEGFDGISLVALVFLALLLIALAVSLSLAYLAFRFRGPLAFPDLVLACTPLAFSVLAVISLWHLA